MLPEETDNYLNEIARVLKTGGRCFATFFVLDEAAEKQIQLNKASFDFSYDMGEYRLLDLHAKAGNVAYKSAWLTEKGDCCRSEGGFISPGCLAGNP